MIFNDIARNADLKKIIEQAASALKAAGANEVYIFCLAVTGAIHENSDLNMAVSGLPPEKFFKALEMPPPL